MSEEQQTNKLRNFNLEFLGKSGNDSETSDGDRVEVGHSVVVAEPGRVTGQDQDPRFGHE